MKLGSSALPNLALQLGLAFLRGLDLVPRVLPLLRRLSQLSLQPLQVLQQLGDGVGHYFVGVVVARPHDPALGLGRTAVGLVWRLLGDALLPAPQLPVVGRSLGQRLLRVEVPHLQV